MKHLNQPLATINNNITGAFTIHLLFNYLVISFHRIAEHSFFLQLYRKAPLEDICYRKIINLAKTGL